MSHARKIAVIGLGYVGLPVAVSLSGKGRVIGFDINSSRIAALRAGHDHTGEVADAELASPDLVLTDDPALLREADFHIVTVPTPVDNANRPDFSPLIAASRTVGRVLKRGDIVVFESTVYPGATEAECVPVLEAESGLSYRRDFTVGYSPERINPGDKERRFETITKVVSGSDAETLEIVAAVYGSVVRAGVHKAPSIAVAEAAKVIENTQRDMNIALMNELSMIFARCGIDTNDVLAAAGTKWNFLRFHPGLVGGHCIGVDPYYLTHRAEQLGIHPQVILSGRRINDSMGAFVAQETMKRVLARHDWGRGRPVVTVLGITFKEDVPDVRNTRAVDVLRELRAFGCDVQVADPIASPREVSEEFGVALVGDGQLRPADAVVVTVAHRAYRDGGWDMVRGCLRDGGGVVADVRSYLDRDLTPPSIDLWRL